METPGAPSDELDEELEDILHTLSTLCQGALAMVRCGQAQTQEMANSLKEIKTKSDNFKRDWWRLSEDKEETANRRLLETGFMDLLCAVIVKGLGSHDTHSENEVLQSPLGVAMGILTDPFNGWYVPSHRALWQRARDDDRLVPTLLQTLDRTTTEKQDWLPTGLAIIDSIASLDDQVTRDRLCQLGTTDVMLQYLLSSDEVSREYAARTLGHILTEEEAHKLTSGACEAFCDLAEDDDADIFEELAENAVLCRALVPMFMERFRQTDDTWKKSSYWQALSALCEKQPPMEQDVKEKLVDLALAECRTDTWPYWDSRQCRRYAARTLQHIVTEEDAHMLTPADVHTAFCHLVEKAADAAVELAKNEVLCRMLVQNGAVSTLVELVRNTNDTQKKHNYWRTLSALCEKQQPMEQDVKEKLLDLALTECRGNTGGDWSCRVYAAGTLKHIITEEDAHKLTPADVCTAFCHLVEKGAYAYFSENTPAAELAENVVLCRMLVQNGAVSKLMELVRQTDSTWKKSSYWRALSALCEKQQRMEQGVKEELLDLALDECRTNTGTDLGIYWCRRYAARTLQHIVTEEDAHMLTPADVHTAFCHLVEKAADAAVVMAENEVLCRMLVQNGAVSALMERVRNTNDTQKKHSYWRALSTLCEKQPPMEQGVKKELLELALAECRTDIGTDWESRQCREYAAQTLKHIVTEKEAHKLTSADACEAFCHLAEEDDDYYDDGIFKILAENVVLCQALVPMFVERVRQTDDTRKKSSYWRSLSTLCKKQPPMEQDVKEELLDLALAECRTNTGTDCLSRKCREYAARTLGHIVTEKEAHKVTSADAFETFRHLAEDYGIFKILAENAVLCRAMVPMMMKGIRQTDDTEKKHSYWRSLSALCEKQPPMEQDVKEELLDLALAECRTNTGTDWESRKCREYAAQTLKHIVTEKEAHKLTSADACEAFCHLAEEGIICMLAENAVLCRAMVPMMMKGIRQTDKTEKKHSYWGTLIVLCEKQQPTEQDVKKKLLDLALTECRTNTGTDGDSECCRRYAARTLKHIVTEEDAHKLTPADVCTAFCHLVEKDADEALRLAENEVLDLMLVPKVAVSMLMERIRNTNDTKKKRSYWQALSALCEKQPPMEQDVKEELLDLALAECRTNTGTDWESRKCRRYAARTLQHIVTEEDAHMLTPADVHTAFCHLVEKAADAAVELAKNEVLCRMLVQNGAVSTLVELVRNTNDTQKKHNYWRALSALCEKQQPMEQDVKEKLLDLALTECRGNTGGDWSCRWYAARTLKHIVTEEDAHKLTPAHVYTAFCHLVEKGADVLYFSGKTPAAELAENVVLCRMLVQNGAVSKLMELVRQTDNTLKKSNYWQTLSALCEKQPLAEQDVKGNVLGLALAECSCNTETDIMSLLCRSVQRGYAARTLKHIVTEEDAHKLTPADVCTAFCHLVEKDDDAAVELAENEVLCRMLVQNGAVSTLVERVRNTNDTQKKRRYWRALSALCEKQPPTEQDVKEDLLDLALYECRTNTGTDWDSRGCRRYAARTLKHMVTEEDAHKLTPADVHTAFCHLVEKDEYVFYFSENTLAAELAENVVLCRMLVQNGAVSKLMELLGQTDGGDTKKKWRLLQALKTLCEKGQQHLEQPQVREELLDLAVSEYNRNAQTGLIFAHIFAVTPERSELCQAAKAILRALRADLERTPRHRQLCLDLGFTPVTIVTDVGVIPVDGENGRNKRKTPSLDDIQPGGDGAGTEAETWRPKKLRVVSTAQIGFSVAPHPVRTVSTAQSGLSVASNPAPVLTAGPQQYDTPAGNLLIVSGLDIPHLAQSATRPVDSQLVQTGIQPVDSHPAQSAAQPVDLSFTTVQLAPFQPTSTLSHGTLPQASDPLLSFLTVYQPNSTTSGSHGLASPATVPQQYAFSAGFTDDVSACPQNHDSGGSHSLISLAPVPQQHAAPAGFSSHASVLPQNPVFSSSHGRASLAPVSQQYGAPAAFNSRVHPQHPVSSASHNPDSLAPRQYTAPGHFTNRAPPESRYPVDGGLPLPHVYPQNPAPAPSCSLSPAQVYLQNPARNSSLSPAPACPQNPASNGSAHTYSQNQASNSSAPSYPQNPAPNSSGPSYPQNPAPNRSAPTYPQNSAPNSSGPSYPQNPAPNSSGPSYPQNPAPNRSAPTNPQNSAPNSSGPSYPQNPAPNSSGPSYPQNPAPDSPAPTYRQNPAPNSSLSPASVYSQTAPSNSSLYTQNTASGGHGLVSPWQQQSTVNPDLYPPPVVLHRSLVPVVARSSPAPVPDSPCATWSSGQQVVDSPSVKPLQLPAQPVPYDNDPPCADSTIRGTPSVVSMECDNASDQATTSRGQGRAGGVQVEYVHGDRHGDGHRGRDSRGVRQGDRNSEDPASSSTANGDREEESRHRENACRALHDQAVRDLEARLDNRLREVERGRNDDKKTIRQLRLVQTKLEGRIKELEKSLLECYDDISEKARDVITKYEQKSRGLREKRRKEEGARSRRLEKSGNGSCSQQAERDEENALVVQAVSAEHERVAEVEPTAYSSGPRLVKGPSRSSGPCLAEGPSRSSGPRLAEGPSRSSGPRPAEDPSREEQERGRTPAASAESPALADTHGMVRLSDSHECYLSRSHFQSALNQSNRSQPGAASGSLLYDGKKLARKLLQRCFSVEERKRGSLADHPKDGYRQLNKDTVDAIIKCCKQYDPNTSEQSLRTAMATSITSLRAKSCKRGHHSQ